MHHIPPAVTHRTLQYRSQIRFRLRLENNSTVNLLANGHLVYPLTLQIRFSDTVSLRIQSSD